MRKNRDLKARLRALTTKPPPSWVVSGVNARPNLHGILRYPAMMVPSMQADILEAIADSTSAECHVLDPFVGSGTTLTEALLRGFQFTGVDINPLAALVCEAKLAIDSGANIAWYANRVNKLLESDRGWAIDVKFFNRDKWFDKDVARRFSKIRRAIEGVTNQAARKVFWVVFAETIRMCSNSRTTTYKLHKRGEGDVVSADDVERQFRINLADTCSRVEAYRLQRKLGNPASEVNANIICGDVRRAGIPSVTDKHIVVVTSPPYGDNGTTIPYGQFSYLALRWIPSADLPVGANSQLYVNTHSLDSASLGGSRKDHAEKAHVMGLVSPAFEKFANAAIKSKSNDALVRVSTFAYDFFEALSAVHGVHSKSELGAHWAITTGNRTAGGVAVPLDEISRDIVRYLGGKSIASIERRLPTKRMPLRNSSSELISTETILVAEFA